MNHRVGETHILASFFLLGLKVIQGFEVASFEQELVDGITDLVISTVSHRMAHGALLNRLVENLTVVGLFGFLLGMLTFLDGSLLGDFLFHDLNHYRFRLYIYIKENRSFFTVKFMYSGDPVVEKLLHGDSSS